MNLRAARPTDAGKLGAILHDFARATPWMPHRLNGAEYIAFAGRMIDRGWVTVAERGAVLGFVARDGDKVASLYAAPFARGAGVGKTLIEHAKCGRDRLELWTCQANLRARRFYGRAGFAEVAMTDGAQNDEGLPDVRLVWERGMRHER